MNTLSEISKNFISVRQKIAEAACSAHRNAQDVTLVAVSKTFGADRIELALKEGHRTFGENRVQEAESKWPALKSEYGGVDLHLIGGLQTNKARAAVELFDVIETLDRPRLARALAKEMDRQDRRVSCFIQVNTGEEAQKSGISPKEADAFIAQCRDEFSVPVDGLMCIPPANEEPSLHFALLQRIAERNGIDQLSMGMSADFEVAVAFGATHVRVGTAIFGQRG